MHAFDVTDIMIEEGVSGSIPIDQRPIGRALVARIQRGDIIIAAKLDRMFRSALDALQIVARLKEKGVTLHLLDLGGDMAANGFSKTFLTIAAAFAEAERDRIRERISQVKADQKERGHFLGGARPFGYHIIVEAKKKRLIPDEAEQASIVRMVAMRAAGKSLRDIAAASGFNISHMAVKKVLDQLRESA